MLLALSWLREFVPYEGEVTPLADKLTMLGLEIEGLADPFAEIRQVVVGHVVEREKHPEADKLSVCTVDVGPSHGGVLQIVCGAPNVAQGQKVPVALVGTSLPGDVHIAKAKLRGVESCGMICSERELGLSEGHAGIMVLPESFAPGANLADALGLERTVLEVNVTPNRADCLSILGLAREVAMGFGLPLTLPRAELHEVAEKAADVVRLDIADGELCPLYQARVLRGVTIGESPAWVKYRLLAMGLRPISNVVDATNYVMLELGQPTHAFDAGLLAGGLIRVQPATGVKTLTTLDGQERKLLDSDLLIWDADKPVALAGVMGGANSEIGASSRDVVLECAIFRPATIRRTARRLGLSSDASYRFERGVDQILAPYACDRVAGLMAQWSGGQVLAGVVRSEPKPWASRVHGFRPARACDLLGLDPAEMSDDFCRQTLTALGCAVSGQGGQWQVETPANRLDLEREVDLIEEVGRVYGVDRIPAVLPVVTRSLDQRWSGEKSVAAHEFGFICRVKAWGRGLGLAEALNYSFVGHKDLDALGLPKDGRIDVANPLTEDQNVMRTLVAPGLLQNLRTNLAHDGGLRLFEVARTFVAEPASETTARERLHLGLLLSGPRHPGFPWCRESEADYADLKGLVEHLCASLGLPAPEFALRQDSTWLLPCVAVSVQGHDVGVLGKVAPAVADEYKARGAVWMAELDLQTLDELCRGFVPVFANLPKFPPVKRDMTLVVPMGYPVAEVVASLRGAGQGLLRDVRVIDEYRPESGTERNLTFRLVYRAADRTLQDAEVDAAHAGLGKHVTTSLPVRFQ